MSEIDEKYTREEEMVGSFMLGLNNYGFNKEAFVDTFMKCHRTLQQKSVSVFIAVLDRMAKQFSYGYYDMRNEAACRFAHEVMEKIPAETRAMPFI